MRPLALLLASAAVCQAADKVKVFILMGQSNMLGEGNVNGNGNDTTRQRLCALRRSSSCVLAKSTHIALPQPDARLRSRRALVEQIGWGNCDRGMGHCRWPGSSFRLGMPVASPHRFRLERRRTGASGKAM